MWIKEKWEDLSIDMNNLTQEMVIGPSNQVAKAIKKLNSRYVTNNYLAGNRSMLEPIKPLGFTRTYRWSPGYKDIIKEVIIERMLQYEKTGSLETMFNRARNMEWSKDNFQKDILSIERKLKQLRARKATTDADLDIANETLQLAFNKFTEKAKEAELVFGLKKDIEYEFLFQYQTFDRISEEPLTDAQIDMLKFLTGSLCLNLKYTNVKLPILNANKNEHYGVLDLDSDLYLSFKLPFYQLFQELQTKSFDELQYGTFTRSQYELDREIDRYLISNDLSTNRTSYHGRFQTCGYFDIVNNIKHPFVGSSNHDTINMFDESIESRNVCFGNMQDDIFNAFMRLDFVDLVASLEQWQSYCVETTNPLNNVSYSISTLPEGKWDEKMLVDAGSVQINLIHQNLLEMNGIDEIHRGNQYSNGDAFWSNQRISYAIIVNGTHADYRRLEENPSDFICGWEFTDPNWIPSIKQIRDVCDPDIEREDVTMEHVGVLQNFLFDSIQATVDRLDEDKCITRRHGHYNKMVNVLKNILGHDCGYELQGIYEVENNYDEDDHLENYSNDNSSEPIVNPNADLPFGSMSSEEANTTLDEALQDDETITFGSAEEIMTAMEQQLMERG